MTGRLSFRAYDDVLDVANIVVDGSPNASTVLTLSHWPGIAQPHGLGADLSAEMAFRYLDDPFDHAPAEAVTNNHFDQDGLVGIHALIDPEASLPHRELLIDVAAGGDFATYRDRSAARASMAIWSYGQQDRSPIGAQLDAPYPEQCALLYESLLPLLLPMVLDPMRFQDLWHDEDEQLSVSEAAIADRRVIIEELAALDLAIVEIDDDTLAGGHRFGHDVADLIHPMALHNATTASRVLLMRGRDIVYIDRYETWVQYRSRRVAKRVDLRPLAARLTELEPGSTTWLASSPSVLTPTLRPDRESDLRAQTVLSALIGHLRTAPAAFDPFEIAT